MKAAFPCTVLFRRSYRCGPSETRLLLLRKEGCPFCTLLACTRDPAGVSCARVSRLTTDVKFALFLIEKCREQKISACHLTDVLEDNADLLTDEYRKAGIPCKALMSE